MKVLFGIFGIAFLFSLNANATFKVNMTGGGQNGYYSVIERHNDDSHSLDCTDPGSTDCCWSLRPGMEIDGAVYDLNEIRLNILNQIESGEIVGGYSLDGKAEVNWDAIDIYNGTITIKPVTE